MNPEKEALYKKILIIVAVIVFAGMGIFVNTKLKERERIKEEYEKIQIATLQKEKEMQENPIEEKETEIIKENLNDNIQNKQEREKVVVNLYPNMKKSSSKLYKASKERERKMYKAGLSKKEFDLKFENTKKVNNYNFVVKRDSEFLTTGEMIEIQRTKNSNVVLESIDIINLLFNIS